MPLISKCHLQDKYKISITVSYSNNDGIPDDFTSYGQEPTTSRNIASFVSSWKVRGQQCVESEPVTGVCSTSEESEAYQFCAESFYDDTFTEARQAVSLSKQR